jgi:hypothetical protein
MDFTHQLIESKKTYMDTQDTQPSKRVETLLWGPLQYRVKLAQCAEWTPVESFQ